VARKGNVGDHETPYARLTRWLVATPQVRRAASKPERVLVEIAKLCEVRVLYVRRAIDPSEWGSGPASDYWLACLDAVNKMIEERERYVEQARELHGQKQGTVQGGVRAGQEEQR
jgi:hypothetical protein